MKFLVVDDDFLILDLIEEFLTLEGFEVEVSSCPLEALEMAKKEEPDCALVDVVMPEMNGYEFYKNIKSLYPEIKVIFVSGHVTEKEMKSELEEEVPFINKPFNRENFITSVKSFIG